MRPLSFAVLAVLTLVAGVAAVLVVALDRPRLATAEPGAPMFPDLAARAAEVAAIRIETAAGVATLRRGDDGWGLAEQGGYPVAEGQAARLIGGLAGFAQIEVKTDDPARLGRLGLAPADGAAAQDRGRRVTLTDAAGATVLDVVLGRARPGLYADRADGLYLRRADETRSWLVRGTVAIPEEPLDWIDRTIVDVDAGDVAHIAVEPAKGAPIVALREAPGGELRLQTVPEGHRAADRRRIAAMAGALQALDFAAARPASDPPADAAPAGTATFTTADGLTLRLALRAAGDALWAEVAASADPIAGAAAPDGEGAAARAAAIDRRTGGWLYRLPSFSADLLTTPLERLVEPAPPDRS